MALPTLTAQQHALLHDGVVIPAHPLALDANRKLDERRQRALTRYYLAAGAGGVAVGVHTTQFAIRDPSVGLYEPVLSLAMEEIRAFRGPEAGAPAVGAPGPRLSVAGVCGPTDQAVREAACARELGYDAGLLSLGGLGSWSEDLLLERARAVSECIPIFGFYLQPAAGGRQVSYRFWRELAEIPNVVAIKIAPFDRYRTIDVVRAVCDSSRRGDIALYTGNDDSIVADLVTPFRFGGDGKVREKRIAGGLLGQWAVWTRSAVSLLERVKRLRRGEPEPADALENLLATGVSWTDANAVLFDAANEFRGCIPGIHEVLVRQGLLAGRWCLDPTETVS
jgi:hypothetical protein